MRGSRQRSKNRVVSRGQSPETMARGSEGFNIAERRELTALFYDLVDSTRLLTQTDLEDYQEIIAAFQQAAKEAAEYHGGSLREILGDGGMVLFGYPVASEYHALPAIRAGLEIITACRRYAKRIGRDSLSVRIGIATSEVVVDDPAIKETDYTVTGIAPTLASRLQSFAEPNTIIVCDRTYKLARRYYRFDDHGVREIKGFENGEHIWRVGQPRKHSSRFIGSVNIGLPMVGRQTELETANRLWRSSTEGYGQMLIVQGEAGVGKTRFVHEIRRQTRAERARMVFLQCSARGMRTALHPIADQILGTGVSSREAIDWLTPEFVRSTFERQGIRDHDTIETFTSLICAAGNAGAELGDLTASQLRERVFLAACNCLSAWLEDGPIVIVVEDAHWIDPTSLDLLEDIAGWIKARAILLVVTTRESIGGLAEAAADERIMLNGLSHHESAELAKLLWNRSAGRPIPSSAADLIYARSNGIPLYVEEILTLAQESSETGSRNLSAFLRDAHIPSFEKILSSRLDSLGSAKDVAYAASVIGREFGVDLVQKVLGNISSSEVEEALDYLTEAGLLNRQGRKGATEYSLRHALFQETIYGMLLRRSRQLLHRRVFIAATDNRDIAPWIRTSALAEHAERAGLIEEAVKKYVRAARENSALYAAREARGLLETALQLIRKIDSTDLRDQLTLTALSVLGPILTSTEGTKSPAACKLYEDAVAIARGRPVSERAEWFPIFWGWWFTGPDVATQRERARIVTNDLRDVDDSEVQLQINHCNWAIDFDLGDHDRCLAAIDSGMRLYQSTRGGESYTLYGGHDARVCGLGQKGLSLWFKGRVQTAIVNVKAARAWANEIGHLGSIAHALDLEAMLLRYRRAFADLRVKASEMKGLAEEFDLQSLHAKAMIFDGWCIGHMNDPKQGEHLVKRGLAIQEEIGTREDFPVYSEMLSELLSINGDQAGALALLSEAIDEAEQTGLSYWLAELYRRQACVHAQAKEDSAETRSALEKSVAISLEQNAMALLLRAFRTAQKCGLAEVAGPDVLARIRDATSEIEPDEDMSRLIEKIKSDSGLASTSCSGT